MTLTELSVEYRSHAAVLRQRMDELEEQYRCSRTKEKRLELERRIRLLSAMHRDAMELAALTEHYYDRGYHSNERYKI